MSAGWSDVLNRLINRSEKTNKKPLSRALVNKEKPSQGKSRKQIIVKSGYESERKKPSIQDKEYERMLQSIATKGVVQLFNSLTALEEPEPEPKKVKREEPVASTSVLDKWGDLTVEDDEEDDAV
ncbi:RRP15-like protein [Panonychus citri]|uniref:RRP15-like protein n=1 Tax=Panonychus citri TaxID=50023 RepID=UPI00230772BD|nr:RRP15-like protein [Panonychus citri]